ncbi:unnamed protein product [Brassicogethes aeneus]|uniref:Endonuclease/exonuclease/phosphatase domain-containing protein n=1 Tax=Brassicogethes aeneus TaxID=1431903 RepID=A0A9P0FME1_BRAAE|nr:unnamed protein product [Brassicogethes aeneus]
MLDNTLTYEKLEDLNSLSIEQHCEISAVLIPVFNLTVITVYRLPNPKGSFVIFMEIIEKVCNKVNFKRGNVLIVDDFNVWFKNVNRQDDDVDASRLIDLLNGFGLSKLVDLPTRNANTIDNAFTNIINTHVDVMLNIQKFPYLLDLLQIGAEMTSFQTKNRVLGMAVEANTRALFTSRLKWLKVLLLYDDKIGQSTSVLHPLDMKSSLKLKS